MGLAAHLGMTLEELRQRMTAREYRLWIKLYDIDPWGSYRDDFRAGIIAATIANVHSHQHTFSATDFIPQFKAKGAEPEELSNEDVMAHANRTFSMIAAAMA